MKNLLKISIILFITLGITSCSNDDDVNTETETNSIADFVAANGDYSSLKAALDKAGLTATLAGPGDFTVFAPNNDAFAVFLTANGFTSLNDVPTDLLKNVLLNHVVSGKVVAADLSTGYINSLATEASSGKNLSMYTHYR